MRINPGRLPIATYGNIDYHYAAMGKKVATTVYITEDQQAKLKALNEQTKVPVAEYIRQGIDLVLDRNAHHIPGQLDLPLLPQEPLSNHLPNLNKK